MAFALIAHDYPDALERRLACREQHLGRLKALAEQGLFLGGGVLLDEDGKMIGSNVHLGFEQKEELEAWLQDEVYVTERIWEIIDIREIRVFSPA